MKYLTSLVFLISFSCFAADPNVVADKEGRGYFIKHIGVHYLYVKEPVREITIESAPNLEAILFQHPLQVRFVKIQNSPNFKDISGLANLLHATVILEGVNFRNILSYRTPFCMGLWYYQTANIIGKEIHEVCTD